MSEFGKGLVYNLGLFLAHADRISHLHDLARKTNSALAYMLWFNGAGDHLYELQWQSGPERLQQRLKDFKEKVLTWRCTPQEEAPTKEEFDWAIQEAKDLLFEIDICHGVDAIKGEWE